MKKDNFLNLCLLWTESCFLSILVVFFLLLNLDPLLLLLSLDKTVSLDPLRLMPDIIEGVNGVNRLATKGEKYY